ncbi:MAG: GNAT family N-acetyltransferase [Cytophagaceae bacterium]|nr:GNAT family N-acetyltransferase [Cytophagaceae bacterium]MBL0303024.1 GNAT family N-acetyltransferase [Cytophagaceae bacterium]MBL0323583.1 GNAT family N-acetyltransferase [Cytophagaceae bacterium]
MEITLEILQKGDKEQFIKNNQIAFQKAYIEEFGESDEMVLPEKDIEKSLENENSVAYRILNYGAWVGGIILSINKLTHHNSLDLFFVNPDAHGKGIGTDAWAMVEKMYPETLVWETHTPYFEKRNIHFYVNKCGFKIVEFFNPYYRDPNLPNTGVDGLDYSFRFEKVKYNH